MQPVPTFLLQAPEGTRLCFRRGTPTGGLPAGYEANRTALCAPTSRSTSTIRRRGTERGKKETTRPTARVGKSVFRSRVMQQQQQEQSNR